MEENVKIEWNKKKKKQKRRKRENFLSFFFATHGKFLSPPSSSSSCTYTHTTFGRSHSHMLTTPNKFTETRLHTQRSENSMGKKIVCVLEFPQFDPIFCHLVARLTMIWETRGNVNSSLNNQWCQFEEKRKKKCTNPFRCFYYCCWIVGGKNKNWGNNFLSRVCVRACVNFFFFGKQQNKSIKKTFLCKQLCNSFRERRR